MRKEFEIHGCIEIPPEMTEEEFWNRFIRFVERTAGASAAGSPRSGTAGISCRTGAGAVMSWMGNRNTRPVSFRTPAFLLPGFPGRILGKTPIDTPRPDRRQ